MESLKNENFFQYFRCIFILFYRSCEIESFDLTFGHIKKYKFGNRAHLFKCRIR